MAIVEKKINGFTIHVKDFAVKQLQANMAKGLPQPPPEHYDTPNWAFDTEATSIEGSITSDNKSSVISTDDKDGYSLDRFGLKKDGVTPGSVSEGYVVSTTMANIIIDTVDPEDEPISLDDEDVRNIVFPCDIGGYFPPSGFTFSVKIRDNLGMDTQALDIYNGDSLIYEIRKNVCNYKGMDDASQIYDAKSKKKVNIVQSASITSIDGDVKLAKITVNFGTTEGIADKLNSGDIKLYAYDVAGNILEFDVSELDWIFMPLSIENFMETCERVQFTYENTRPSKMFLNANVEGVTSVETYNPNWPITSKSFIIITNLDDDSLGYMPKPGSDNEKISFDNLYLETSEFEKIYNNKNRTEKVLKDPEAYYRNHYSERKVTAITGCGNVTCYGYITPLFWKQPAAGIIRKLTYNTSKLGEWITEAASNVRKIEAETYVPETVKSTSYGNFVDFLKFYLDTMYEDFDTGNKIGILEKIERIGDFNDSDLIEVLYLNSYAKQRGFNFKINLKILEATLRFVNTVSQQSTVSKINATSALRNIYHTLPYIVGNKGVLSGLKILYNLLGLELVYADSEVSNDAKMTYLTLYFNNEKFKYSHDKITPNIDKEQVDENEDETTTDEIMEFLINYGNALLPANKLITSLAFRKFTTCNVCEGTGVIANETGGSLEKCSNPHCKDGYIIDDDKFRRN